MRYLAIDHGQKRTGLAVCDAAETLASPLEVVENAAGLIRRIKQAVEDYRIEALVVGLPLNMDGTEGPRTKEVKKFVRELRGEVRLPVHYFDERLSSFSAEKKMVDMELTRRKKKKRLDALAAAEILQAFLDHKAAPAPEPCPEDETE